MKLNLKQKQNPGAITVSLFNFTQFATTFLVVSQQALFLMTPQKLGGGPTASVIPRHWPVTRRMAHASPAPASRAAPGRGGPGRPAVGLRGADAQVRRAGAGGRGPGGAQTREGKLTRPAAPLGRSLSQKPQSRRRDAGNSTVRAADAAISARNKVEDVFPGS